jgi:hypothetical protein
VKEEKVTPLIGRETDEGDEERGIEALRIHKRGLQESISICRVDLKSQSKGDKSSDRHGESPPTSLEKWFHSKCSRMKSSTFGRP